MTIKKQVAIRLPVDVKNWLEAQAAVNASSQTSEIVRAIRERMSRTETDSPNT